MRQVRGRAAGQPQEGSEPVKIEDLDQKYILDGHKAMVAKYRAKEEEAQ